jgi:hypothetical protein
VGIGARREWEGTTAALARVCLGWSSGRALVFGNLRLEKPFAKGRDAIDLITTLGWSQRLGQGLRVGVEGVGEDLEGFWDAEEAEGGAKLYVGPAIHWSAPAGRLWLSASGGPIIFATRSGRTSPCPSTAGRLDERLHRAAVDRLYLLMRSPSSQPARRAGATPLER